MTHTIYLPTDVGQSILLGWSIQANSLPTTTIGSLFWGKTSSPPSDTTQVSDPMLTLLARSVLVLGVRYAEFAFGLSSLDSALDETTVNMGRPVNLDYSPSVDRDQNGGVLAGIYSALKPSRMAGIEQIEKSVQHSSPRGQSLSSSSLALIDRYQYGTSESSIWTTAVKFPIFKTGKTDRYGYWNNTTRLFTGVSGYNSGSTSTYWFLQDLLQHVSDAFLESWGAGYLGEIQDEPYWPDLPSTWQYHQLLGNYYKTLYRLLDLNFETDNGVVTFDYTWLCVTWTSGAWPNGHYVCYKVHKTVRAELIYSGTLVGYSTGNKDFKNMFYLRLTLLSGEIADYRRGPDLQASDVGYSFVNWIGTMTFQPTVHNRTSATASGEGGTILSNFGGACDPSAAISAITHKTHNLYWFYREHEHDLHASTFYSSCDAIDTFVDVVTSNQLENLSELRGLGKGVTDIGRLLKSFRDFRRGDLLGSIHAGISTYADYNLARSYGFDPSIADFNEFVQEYDSCIARLRQIGVWGFHTLYGKFDFDLPNDDELGAIHLTARSKLRMGVDDTTLMAIIFGGAAIGLRPGLSLVWECVPFSFVVDWFTNLSRRFKDIDDQILMFLLSHYYGVHSLTLENEWDSSWMSSYHLECLPGDLPRSTFYYRWLSYILPVMRPSLYDFRGTSELPSLKTAGSLAWSITS